MTCKEYKVSSEIYDEFDYKSSLKPVVDPTNIVSKFSFSIKLSPSTVDADGDILVTRKSNVEKCIEIEHSSSTILNLVGLQIWRGAFLLADWLMYNSDKLINKTILELGSGVGLTSIVASMYVPVFSTDVNRGDLFKLIEANYSRNKSLTKFPLKVLELDFFSENLSENIKDALKNVSFIIAADVIYDNELTNAFINTIKNILLIPPQKTIIIALEKRFVFTIADCDSVAPCYEHFLECLDKLKNAKIEEIPCDFPQYFKYDRVKQLVLWKITSVT